MPKHPSMLTLIEFQTLGVDVRSREDHEDDFMAGVKGFVEESGQGEGELGGCGEMDEAVFFLDVGGALASVSVFGVGSRGRWSWEKRRERSEREREGHVRPTKSRSKEPKRVARTVQRESGFCIASNRLWSLCCLLCLGLWGLTFRYACWVVLKG
jgi:hypothetical protein